MTVRHDAFDAPDKSSDNPLSVSQNKAEEGDAKYWENKAKAATAQAEYEEARRRAAAVSAAPPEQPFKIKGEVNLGSFDFQKQTDELKNQLDTIKAERDQQISQLQQNNENYRQQMHEIELKMMEQSWQARFDALTKMLQQPQNMAQQKGILEQLSEIDKISTALGYRRFSAADAAVGGDSLSMKLAIMKMEAENARAEREFSRQMREDDRNWQMQLKKIELDAAAKTEELNLARERQKFMTNLPNTIGGAIAKGLLSRGQGIEESAPIEERVPTPPANQSNQPNPGFEAGYGEAGEVPCPKCQKSIFIGPDSTQAVCPSCGGTWPIQRRPAERVV